MKLLSKEVGIAIVIYLIILFGVLPLFDYRPPPLGAILLYIVIYTGVTAVFSRITPPEEKIEQEELPTSGPIGRFGQSGLIAAFTVTGLLSLLNPFQLYQIVMQGVGNLWL